MKQSLYLLSALAATLLCITSCGAGGCEETRETYCYADISTDSKSTKLNSMAVWYNDTLITDTYTSPTAVELILPPDSSHIQYRFDMTVTVDEEAYQVSDTLDISYEAFPYFLNMECGCSVYFTINEVNATQHFWKSVEIKNKEISNEEDVNLRIVY